MRQREFIFLSFSCPSNFSSPLCCGEGSMRVSSHEGRKGEVRKRGEWKGKETGRL